MKKKILFINIIVVIAVALTGCWNAMELNTLGINLVLGLDFENGKVIVTAEIIEPVPAKEKKVPWRRLCCYICSRHWGQYI